MAKMFYTLGRGENRAGQKRGRYQAAGPRRAVLREFRDGAAPDVQGGSGRSAPLPKLSGGGEVVDLGPFGQGDGDWAGRQPRRGQRIERQAAWDPVAPDRAWAWMMAPEVPPER